MRDFQEDCSESLSPISCIKGMSTVRIYVLPTILALLIPTLASTNGRFLIQVMVEEKQFKVKESLNLMSLSYQTQAKAFIAFQMIYALLSAVLVTGPIIYQPKLFFQTISEYMKILHSGLPVDESYDKNIHLQSL